jgi:hypothetical protein
MLIAEGWFQNKEVEVTSHRLVIYPFPIFVFYTFIFLLDNRKPVVSNHF